MRYKANFSHEDQMHLQDYKKKKKSYQNFHDKRLARPGSKYLIWQRTQAISYKAKL